MISVEEFQRLLSKWAADASGYRAEARRVERIDPERHAKSIAMLEASALAIKGCVREAEALNY